MLVVYWSRTSGIYACVCKAPDKRRLGRNTVDFVCTNLGYCINLVFFAPVLWFLGWAGRQISWWGDLSLWWWKWVRLGQWTHFFGARVALVGTITSKNRKVVSVGVITSKSRKVVWKSYITAGRNIAGSLLSLVETKLTRRLVNFPKEKMLLTLATAR